METITFNQDFFFGKFWLISPLKYESRLILIETRANGIFWLNQSFSVEHSRSQISRLISQSKNSHIDTYALLMEN